MGETWIKIQQIAHDLKVSRYFDIWAGVWAIMAIVGFACMIILAQRAQNRLAERDIRIWLENATTINFPQFHVRFGGGENETIIDQQCTHMGVPLNVMPCQPYRGVVQPINRCVAINSSSVVANQNIVNTERIQCTIYTFITPGNSLMAFEFEGQNIATYGGNSYASVWFAANSNAWIMLEKALYDSDGNPEITEWHRSLLYHSTAYSPGVYNITVIIGSYAVEHWEQVDSYTGWMSAGDIGGFGFFLVIIHSIIMMIVGVFFKNNAVFLGGKEEAGYNRT